MPTPTKDPTAPVFAKPASDTPGETPSLVNESKILEPEARIKVLEEIISGQEEKLISNRKELEKRTAKIEELQEKSKRAGFEPSTRMFRIYLEIIGGAVSRGSLEPDVVKKSGGPAYVKALCEHYANIATHAQAATDNKF